MTDYFVSLADGDDTTGDGTYGNPYATVLKASDSCSPGDNIKVKKTPGPVKLTGTLTFVNNSVSVATSADLTSEISAGDLIGRNATLETWWYVNSLTSSVITLASPFWGVEDNSNVATDGYKITPVIIAPTSTVNFTSSVSGSDGSPITISGGWDFSTLIKDGITCFGFSANRYSFYFNNKNYIHYDNFILQGKTYTYNGFYFTGVNRGNKIENVHLCELSGSNYNTINGINNNLILKDCFVSGGPGIAFTINGLVFNLMIDGVILYSIGTATGDFGFQSSSDFFGKNITFKDVKIYNQYAAGINFMAGHYSNLTFKNCTVKNIRSATQLLQIGSWSNNFEKVIFDNCSFNSNQNSNVVYLYQSGGLDSIYFKNCEIVNDSYPLKAIIHYENTNSEVMTWIYTVNNDGSDPVSYAQNGTMTITETGARSGKCIKLTPTNADFGVNQRLGKKIVSSIASDISLNVYMKKSNDFNGNVYLSLLQDTAIYLSEAKTLTTDYVQYSITIQSEDLLLGCILDLEINVSGNAGSVYIDDFS